MLAAVEADRQQNIEKAEPGPFFSYDGGDQGFLNAFFSDWYTLNSSHRLPFEYNTLASMAHLYPPAFGFLHNRRLIRVLHFSGDPDDKPWYTGQRVLTATLAPYLFLWSRMARQVRAQFVAHQRLFAADRDYARRFFQAHSYAEGIISPDQQKEEVTEAQDRLIFADAAAKFPHPWSSFPPLFERQPAFVQYAGNLADKDTLLKERNAQVIQSWFESQPPVYEREL